MNLRDQLKEILPDILPRNPAQAIKGTELIELVKYRLKQGYSDATLRYHFSIMSCDPSSPIAKVEQGQGYYLRSTTIHSLHSARNMINVSQGVLGEEFALSSEDSDISISRANKFRAVVQRYFESLHRFPLAFERSFSHELAEANRWRIPDMVVVEWLVGEIDGESLRFNREELEVRRSLGESPLRVSGLKLRLEATYAALRKDLYQCLAASEWTNAGEMLVAAPIDDEQLVEEIRQFALKHGIGVTTFGLDADVLDDMPEPAAIENLLPREFDAIQSLFRLRRISSSGIREGFDWEHVTAMQTENEDFGLFHQWISKCLLSRRALTAQEFIDETSGGHPGKEDLAQEENVA